MQIVELQILIGAMTVGLSERPWPRAVENGRDSRRAVVPGVGIERHAARGNLLAEHRARILPDRGGHRLLRYGVTLDGKAELFQQSGGTRGVGRAIAGRIVRRYPDQLREKMLGSVAVLCDEAQDRGARVVDHCATASAGTAR